KEQLENLHRMVDENEQAFCDALYKDLHKHKYESLIGELAWVKQEALDTISNLKSWAEPNYVKIIMSAAAEHLTPVTLELGGKSPAIVANDMDISILAKRIIWSKMYNCGQTCIAPDYMICERSVQDAFIKEVPKVIEQFYGLDPQSSTSHYCRIINKSHFDRLQNLLNQTKGRIVHGGNFDRDDLYISPTIVADVPKEDKLMEDEIFGPIFPIVVVKNLDEAIEYVNSRDIPLALYPFIKDLPFGGQGPSGIGSYHGKRSFDTFSHERSVMTSPFAMEKLAKARYPP
ncbi:15069_t:CDS:2, partial [Racocetra fulgida]